MPTPSPKPDEEQEVVEQIPQEGGEEVETSAREDILTPEVVERIMEKVMDINTPGMGVHGVTGARDNPRSISTFCNTIGKSQAALEVGLMPYLQKFNVDGEEEDGLNPKRETAEMEKVKEYYVSSIKNKATMENNKGWRERLWFNVLGRSLAGVDFDHESFGDVAPAKKVRDLMYSNGTAFLLDANKVINNNTIYNEPSNRPVAEFNERRGKPSEIEPEEKIERWEDLPYNGSENGYYVDSGRISPHCFRGLIIGKDKDGLTVEQLEKLRKLTQLYPSYSAAIGDTRLSEEAKKLKDELVEEGAIVEDARSHDKWLSIAGHVDEPEDDPAKQEWLLQQYVEAMLEANKDYPDRLIPIYNSQGDLLWPEQMSYEEVQQLVEERNADAQE